MKIKKPKVRLAVTLDEDVLKRLQDEAENDSRPVSQYLNLLLIKYFRAIDENNLNL